MSDEPTPFGKRGATYETQAQYPTYLDVETQVKPWLQFSGLSLTSTTTFVLQLITDSVCTECAQFTGGPIAPTRFGPGTGIGRFDGAGGLMSGYIMLPRYPVIQITEVIEYIGNEGYILTEVPPTGHGSSSGGPGSTMATGYQCNYRTGRLTRVLGGIWNRPFYPGSNNVWVTWYAGYNPIPTDIIRASLEWVAEIYRNTQQILSNGPPVGATNEYEAMQQTRIPTMWTGMSMRVADVLKPYMHVGVR